jgi:hypothetical protein
LSFGHFDFTVAGQITVGSRTKHDQTKTLAALNVLALMNPGYDSPRNHPSHLYNA